MADGRNLRRTLWLLGFLSALTAGIIFYIQADSARIKKIYKKWRGGPVGLGIHGFNYTDLPIELFSVGSSGGGNIFVSSPTSGGGGTTCCYTWYQDTRISMPVEVEWMRTVNGKERWCVKTVILHGPYPDDPFAIAIHFMPDGDVIPEITAGFPDVKLSLERFDPGHRKADVNTTHDEQVAQCRYGY